MDPRDFLAWVMGGSLLVVGLVAAFASRKSEKKFWEIMTAALSDPELRWKENEPAFRYRDLDFFLRQYDGSRNKPPSFSVTVECRETGGEFEISQEDGVERLFKSAGVTREVQTPEEEFNRRFFIASDTPQFAQDYFSSAEKREAVKKIFDRKASTVTHRGQRLTVTWKGNFAHEEGAAGMKSAVEALAVLVKEIPLCHDDVSPALTSDGGGSSFSRVLVGGLAAVSAAAGLMTWSWTSASYPVYDTGKLFLFSLRFSLPVLAVFLYVAFKTLAGNSRSHRDILWTGFLALAGFLLLGCGLAGLYNGGKDASSPAGHTALIVDKQIYTPKDSSTYWLTVRSWRPGNASEEIKTDRSTYKRAVRGESQAMVYTKPGKLGFEWFVSHRMLPPAPDSR
jgi:hypothetical protein